jgi:hypothetical protein
MSHRRDAWTWVLGAMALATFANAAWMLVDPARWYRDLPAGVPDTGPYNEHFVRDIGCAFLVMALALGWAAVSPRWRVPLCAIAASFLVAHAGLHVFDTLRGFLDAGHWWLDLPGVYAPAVLATWAALHFLRSDRERA